MNEDVSGSNSESEQTDSDVSPTSRPNAGPASSSRGESSRSDDSRSDDQSREDDNTPSDEDDSDTEGLSDKAQKRFQKLAGDKRKLSEEVTSLRETNRQRLQETTKVVREKMQQSPDPGYRVQAQLALNAAQIQQDQEDREFDKASRKFPELDPEGENYDREFHDDVWQYREGSKDRFGNPTMTFSEAAARLKKRDQRISSKAAHEAETQIESKQANSAGSQKRTPPTDSPAKAGYKEAMTRFSQSGSVEDLHQVLKARSRAR